MIIWGTKRVERKLGRVADHCPMCREVRAFALRKISMVGHIYYVGLGRGETVGHFGVGESSGFEMGIDPTEYDSIAKPRSREGVRELVQQTFPNIQSAYAERFELEKRLEESPAALEPELRQELIREVLQNASPAFEERYAGSTQLDWRAGLSLLIAVFGPMAILILAGDAEASGAAFRYAALAVLGGGLVSMGYFAATTNRRWLRQHMLPMLTQAYRQLRPSQEELDGLIAKVRAADLKIGKKLKAKHLCESLERSRPERALV